MKIKSALKLNRINNMAKICSDKITFKNYILINSCIFSSSFFWFVFFILLFNSILLSQNENEQFEIVSKHDSIVNYQDTTLLNSENKLLFPRFKFQLGAELANLVHIGLGYRISDKTMIELNIAPPIPNLFIASTFGILSLGSSVQIFEDEGWVINALVPVWLTLNANESLYFFPAFNLGWNTNLKMNKKKLGIMLRGGVSYNFEYNYYRKELIPSFIFFNLGFQLGFSIID